MSPLVFRVGQICADTSGWHRYRRWSAPSDVAHDAQIGPNFRQTAHMRLDAPRRSRIWLLLALGGCSACSVALLMVRNRATGSVTHRYLVWNLLLAWIPLLAALAADRWDRRRWTLLAWSAAWLVFFPNAPYLVTDLIHLEVGKDIPLWYDALLFASFSTSGVLLGNASLSLVQAALKRRFGAKFAWCATFTSLLLGGYGIYLGRVERWNSWDLWTRPAVLLQAATRPILDPLGNRRAIAMSILFAGFLVTAYLATFAMSNLHRVDATHDENASRTSPSTAATRLGA
jgi:uncharacterized membrane protein